MPKNPFGMRDGRIITIGMLRANERGLNCRCKCVLCGGDLVARFCKGRIDHFAHRAGACNETKAFIKGITAYIAQLLQDGMPLPVPAVCLTLQAPISANITATNIKDYLALTGDIINNFWSVKVAESMNITFERVELEHDYLLCHLKGHTLAVVVKPPDTICKSYTTKSYKELATLSLEFTEEAFLKLVCQEQPLQALLNTGFVRLCWISNPVAWKAIPTLLKRHTEWQAKQRQEVEKRKEDEAAQTQPHKVTALEMQSIKKLFDDSMYDELILDSTKTRWVKCVECGRIAPDGEFTYIGGYGNINWGLCRVCNKKHRAETHA